MIVLMGKSAIFCGCAGQRRREIVLLFVLFLLSGICPVAGQDIQKNIQSFMERLQYSYARANYLDFHVKYIYANAGKPGLQMDSLSGEVAMDKGRSRFVIDGTETIVTEKYAIRVMNENKLIYLSKPGNMGMMDPSGLLDSVLSHVKGATANVETVMGGQTLTINLPPGQQYSRVRMTMNEQTGWLDKIEYDVHTSGLVGEEQIASATHPGVYEQEGKVTVLFSGYRKGGFGDGVFDESRIFTRVGSEFTPVGQYKDYQIFLASSNF